MGKTGLEIVLLCKGLLQLLLYQLCHLWWHRPPRKLNLVFQQETPLVLLHVRQGPLHAIVLQTQVFAALEQQPFRLAFVIQAVLPLSNVHANVRFPK